MTRWFFAAASAVLAAAGSNQLSGTPMPLDDIDVAGVAEQNIVAVPSESRVYFASNNTKDLRSKGGFDIWVAKKDPSGHYGSAAVLESVSSDADELPSWVSPNSCQLVFTRSSPDGRRKIWIARKPPP